MRGDEQDETPAQVLAFFQSTRLAEGCYCGNDEVQEGRDLVLGYAHGLPLGDDAVWTVAECRCVLRYLSNIEPKSEDKCYGHTGEVEACGFQAVLGLLAMSLEKIEQTAEA